MRHDTVRVIDTYSRFAFLALLAVVTVIITASPVRAQQRSQAAARNRLTSTEVAKRASPSMVTITTATGQGSGVIVDASGVILTNLHVLRGQPTCSVKLANGDIYDDVAVVDVDARKDLLLIKIKAVDLASARLGNSDESIAGDRVVLIGSPRGLDLTVSDGLISAIRDSGEGYRLIQTDAAASPGSSGGGMFNEFGELIGVLTSKVPTGENLNFAVPVNYVRGLLSTQIRMTLAQLAKEHPADSSGGSADRRASSRPALQNDRARLEALLRESGLRHEKSGDDAWKISFKGEKAESVTVYVSTYSDLAIAQSTIATNFNAENVDTVTAILRQNFDNDLAKVGLTDKRTLEALNEAELRLLDGEGLKRTVTAVATLADDVFGLLQIRRLHNASALVGPQPARQLKSLDLLRRQMSIQFDASTWKHQRTDGGGVYEFQHTSGGVHIKVISEPLEIPLDKMFDIALTNARNVDPSVKEVKRGLRLVNGKQVGFLEFDALVNNIQIRYYGHYYSDDAGTVQILAWSLRDIFESYRNNVDAFVSGLHRRSPTP